MPKKIKDVLIVEDQPFFQDILKQGLKSIIPDDSNIKTVNSGNTAIELLKEQSESVGLILLDMKMDDGDGVTVLNFLEKQELYDIPVYIVSSLDREFINFVMLSVSELEVRLVGFIPKDTPNAVISRLKELKQEIVTFLVGYSDIVDNDNSTSLPETDTYTFNKQEIEERLNNDLLLYVQPKINLENNYISGFEVLSRLYDNELGVVEPSKFMPALDNYQMRETFNWLVIEKVFRFQNSLNNKGAVYPFSINVDPEVLANQAFVDKLESMANALEIDLHFITFEITEIGQSQEESSNFYLNIARLKLLGAKVALDDFGKGWSNLDRVERIPFDEIKLDMSLTSKVPGSEQTQSLIMSLVSVFKNKGCSIVAEGVEDQETHNYLKSIGVSEVQGYYHAMPKPISYINEMLIQSLLERVSLLLGDMTAEHFAKIYNSFYENTRSLISAYLELKMENEIERKDFLHKVKGTIKTAGLYEALIFIERYAESGDIAYLHKLKMYLAFFNKEIVKGLLGRSIA